MVNLKSKIIAAVSVVSLLSAAVLFTSCRDEDENDMLKGYSISYGHPTDAATSYSRSWNVTHTNHISANVTITIDRTSLTTKGATGLKTTTALVDGNGPNNTGYIFGLEGTGSASDPYRFGLIGFRLIGEQPQYFISWYTGVQDSYCNSDAGDFDVDEAANTAREYALVAAWTNLDADAYTLTADALTVVVKIDAVTSAGVAATNANYDTVKGTLTGYKISLYKNSSAATAGITMTLKKANLTAEEYLNKSAQTLEEFNIPETRLGFYAMVHKGAALVSKLDFDNSSIVKSVAGSAAGPVDNFGKYIDIEGEVLTNIK